MRICQFYNCILVVSYQYAPSLIMLLLDQEQCAIVESQYNVQHFSHLIILSSTPPATIRAVPVHT